MTISPRSGRFYKKPGHWEKNSQIVPNSLFFNAKTSDALKVLLCALNALPESWIILQSDMRQRLGWGRDKMMRTLKECVTHGYMIIKKRREENGEYGGNDYEFDFHPSYLKECLPDTCFQDPVNQDPVNETLLGSSIDIPCIENTTTPEPEPPKKKEPGTVVVFSCLGDLEIPESLKVKISKEHQESEVNVAVKRCLAWKGRPNDKTGLLTCLANSATWTDQVDKKQIVESNERYLKTLRKYDGVTMAFTTITVGVSYIEFACGRRVEVFESSLPDLKKVVDAKIARIKELYEKA